MIATTIANMSGKILKKDMNEEFFIRDYLGENEPAQVVIKEYSLEEQRARFLAFKEKVRSVRPQWVHDKDKHES